VRTEDYAALMTVELHDRGLDARTDVELWWPSPGHEVDLLTFLRSLADDWRGWPDVRHWRSNDATMRIQARHDNTGHVELTATLLDDASRPDTWSASATVTIEAGEQLAQLVADMRDLLGR
jgi:hypothetical protein